MFGASISIQFDNDSVKDAENMAGVSWQYGGRKAIIITEERTIMNGRRWKSNFPASISRMTIGVFVIFLSLQGILVKGVSGAAASATQPDIHPEVQTTTATSAPTKSNPQATHPPPLSSYITIVPQRDPKFQQQQRQQQQSKAPKNSVGYVAGINLISVMASSIPKLQ